MGFMYLNVCILGQTIFCINVDDESSFLHPQVEIVAIMSVFQHSNNLVIAPLSAQVP